MIAGTMVRTNTDPSGSKMLPLSVYLLKNLIYSKLFLSTYPFKLSPQIIQPKAIIKNTIVTRMLAHFHFIFSY